MIFLDKKKPQVWRLEGFFVSAMLFLNLRIL